MLYAKFFGSRGKGSQFLALDGRNSMAANCRICIEEMQKRKFTDFEVRKGTEKGFSVVVITSAGERT